MLAGASVFATVLRPQTFDSSSFIGHSVIIVKSNYIPTSFKFSDLLVFLQSESDIHTAAIERLFKNYTIAVGYPLPNRVPKLATSLRNFLIRNGVRPALHTASLSSSELEGLLRTVTVPTIERYFSEQPDAEPGRPGADAGPEPLLSFDDWWAALDRPWHIAPVEVSIAIGELEAGLDLFQGRVTVDHPTEFRKMNVHVSNRMLQLPIVGPDVQAEIMAHRSFFEDELEEEARKRPV
jgi:hypothetical protein